MSDQAVLIDCNVEKLPSILLFEKLALAIFRPDPRPLGGSVLEPGKCV